MVEKRPSPVAESPQRHKKLSTQPSIDAISIDVKTTCNSPQNDTLNEMQMATTVTPTSPTPNDGQLHMLVFHERFQLLALDNTPVVTQLKHDAQGDSWRVIWHPRSPTDPSFVSVFVELVTHDENDHSRRAEVSIMLVNHGNHSPLIKHTSVHAFTMEKAEFGMNQFLPRSTLMNPNNGFLDEQGQVEFKVRLTFVSDMGTLNWHGNDPHEKGLLDTTDHLSSSYDSKKETGMVGLKNQGATCYLNSLLQTLFHLRAFRQVVYETPTALEDTNESVSLALQRVFYRLQRQVTAVSTKELTRSFGWSAIDSFMQHDVQELYRILCDRLEEKMKSTRVDSALQVLFEGKVRSFVQCVHVDFTSYRDECFYDLQLDVKGCRTLVESFRKYVEVELLQHDNQYDAEGYGKQDARKGLTFLSLPPVLNIQLKRFEYDAMRDGMVKIHDRFEFPKVLHLEEFLATDVTTNHETRTACYHLHSVLVHSGDVHGGHYYVFIRPGKSLASSTDWFKFDDDHITQVTEQVAIEGNYGSGGATQTTASSIGHSSEPSLIGIEMEGNRQFDSLEFQSVDTTPMDGTGDIMDGYSQQVAHLPRSEKPGVPLNQSFSSAYMLVYVRDGENDIHAIHDDLPMQSKDYNKSYAITETPDLVKTYRWQLNPVPIPQELVTRFHEEETIVARRKRAQQTEYLYMNVRIVSDTSVANLKRITRTLDFAGFNNCSTIRIRIKRAASIWQLYTRVYHLTGVPLSRQRLWKVITRENRTTRPDQALGPDVYNCCVESLIEDDASLKAPVKLYLQILDALSETPLHAIQVSKGLSRRKTKTAPARLYRYFLDEFVPLEDEGTKEATIGPEEGKTGVLGDDWERSVINSAPALASDDILLFIKFYDVTKELDHRLEYVGNVVVDSRITGAELEEYLHEALSIPLAKMLVLYEEIQPTTVSEIQPDATLGALEIQNGDIICYQYATNLGNTIVLNAVDEVPDASELIYTGPDGEPVKTILSSNSDEKNIQDTFVASEGVLKPFHRIKYTERYPDVPLYFQYLLDRIEVTFYRYGLGEEKSFTLSLLLSNVYDEVIDAVAAHLGLKPSQRLFLRLYQHSPINHLPMKSPLRHSRYAGDTQTTLEELLTEYMDRTNIMYIEVLEHPITEIEAKKELDVYLSSYDECFASTEPTTSLSLHRHVELLVRPTDTVNELLQLLREGFGLPLDTPLRACEVVQHGTMITHVVEKGTELSRYWGRGHVSDPNTAELLVELIPSYEVADKTSTNDSIQDARWFYKGVVHFNFQHDSEKWIHPHGVPCMVRFQEKDTVGDLKERIRQRMGISASNFAQWSLALVKNLKASRLLNIYNDMDEDAVDEFPMSRLMELCGEDFEALGSIGLEHADRTPPLRHHSNRRLETGIHIR